MTKDVYIVCGLNSSRSLVIEAFLKDKYSSNPEINIKSAGLNVYTLREDDKRTRFIEEMAEEADLIFVSDHDKFYRVRYNLLKNDKEKIKKVHLLRIPDVFYTHKNAFLSSPKNADYNTYMQKIREEPEFSQLLQKIEELTPREASVLTEAIYIKELYSTHLRSDLRQDKRYPFELLDKTLEFRFPLIDKLIKEISNKK